MARKKKEEQYLMGARAPIKRVQQQVRKNVETQRSRARKTAKRIKSEPSKQLGRWAKWKDRQTRRFASANPQKLAQIVTKQLFEVPEGMLRDWFDRRTEDALVTASRKFYHLQDLTADALTKRLARRQYKSFAEKRKMEKLVREAQKNIRLTSGRISKTHLEGLRDEAIRKHKATGSYEPLAALRDYDTSGTYGDRPLRQRGQRLSSRRSRERAKQEQVFQDFRSTMKKLQKEINR